MIRENPPQRRQSLSETINTPEINFHTRLGYREETALKLLHLWTLHLAMHSTGLVEMVEILGFRTLDALAYNGDMLMTFMEEIYGVARVWSE